MRPIYEHKSSKSDKTPNAAPPKELEAERQEITKKSHFSVKHPFCMNSGLLWIIQAQRLAPCQGPTIPLQAIRESKLKYSFHFFEETIVILHHIFDNAAYKDLSRKAGGTYGEHRRRNSPMP
jgi:hypothetical protein